MWLYKTIHIIITSHITLYVIGLFCHVWSEIHLHIRIWESVEKKDERIYCLCQWPKSHSCSLSRLRNYRKTINVIPFPPVSFEAFGIKRKKEISFGSASLSQASACRLFACLMWTDAGLACCSGKESDAKQQEAHSLLLKAHSVLLKAFQSVSFAHSRKIIALSLQYIYFFTYLIYLA